MVAVLVEQFVLALDRNELTAAAVNVANDSIVIIDADDPNGSKKESIADLVAQWLVQVLQQQMVYYLLMLQQVTLKGESYKSNWWF